MTLTQTSQQLWTRDFILMSIVNLFLAASSFMLIPTLPIYASKVLGANQSEIGYIVGLYTFSALFIRPFVGIGLDTIGRKPIYLLGLFLFLLMMPLYYFTTVMFLLIGLRLLHGFTWGMTTTGGSTIISDIVPPLRRGEGIGYFGMSFTIAMALGPVLGLFLVNEGDYYLLFLSATLLVCLTFIIANFISYPQMSKDANITKVKISTLLEIKALSISSLVFIASFIYGGLITFITLYCKSIGIEQSAYFFLFYAIGLTVVRPFAGKDLDKNGPKRVLAFGFIFLAIGLGILASIQDLSGLIVASLVSGLGMGSILPTTLTMVVNIVEPDRRGVANSTFFSAVDIGVSLGAISLGILTEFTSYRFIFYACSILIILPLLLFLFWVKKDYDKKLLRI